MLVENIENLENIKYDKENGWVMDCKCCEQCKIVDG
jgi:hypothetical protein